MCGHPTATGVRYEAWAAWAAWAEWRERTEAIVRIEGAKNLLSPFHRNFDALDLEGARRQAGRRGHTVVIHVRHFSTLDGSPTHTYVVHTAYTLCQYSLRCNTP